MTLTADTDPRDSNPAGRASVDLYRDIHKGIRAELFAVTGQAGRVDPASRPACTELADHVRGLMEVLEVHAEHEDGVIQPVLDRRLPELAARVHDDHELLSKRTTALIALVDQAADSSGELRNETAHELYLELADFTGVYLAHQGVEERIVSPALLEAVGPEEVAVIHGTIIASIPPDQMARSLAFMLPAMNVDNRAELLGGVQVSAPAPVFEGVWALAASVLDPADHAAVGARLGLT